MCDSDLINIAMHITSMNRTAPVPMKIITAGSTYLDIDAYACAVAMAELLQLQGEPAVAYSAATANYSVCTSLTEEGKLLRTLPPDCDPETAQYIIVDVSDPGYIKDAVPLAQVTEVYDHHTGFEAYWQDRIGDRACIEFIGAAATLIYRRWQEAGRTEQMSVSTARLLTAAILDNTLYLTSANTTPEDKAAFRALCRQAGADADWCAAYFSDVQKNVEADLRNALMGDLKTMWDDTVLPHRIAQLCVWDARCILGYLPDIRQWFGDTDSWMINIISIKEHGSYFVCEDLYHQQALERIFDVRFAAGSAKTERAWLRKEIIRQACHSH